MTSDPNRRHSRGLPPNLSELMEQLNHLAHSYITEFDNKKPQMEKTEKRFQVIADEVKHMHEYTDTARTVGATGLGIFALGVITAPFTGGTSLATGTVFGGALGAGGSVTVVATNVIKHFSEKESVKEMERLGEEFLVIVKPLKDDLENIMKTCEKLEEKSKEVQAANTLTDLETFQGILRKVSELRRRSGEVFDATVQVVGVFDKLLALLILIFRVFATPEEDKKLRDSIIESSRLCSKVTEEFKTMKEELKSFSAVES